MNRMLRGMGLLLAVLPASAQLLYNEHRDKQAQEAQKLAAELQNGTVFQKAIDNLDVLWQQRQDRVMRNAEDQMKARLAVLQTWKQMDDFLVELSTGIGPDSSPNLNAAGSPQKSRNCERKRLSRN